LELDAVRERGSIRFPEMLPILVRCEVCWRWCCNGIWSFPSTLGFVDDKERSTHFGDHRWDFSASNKHEYEAEADKFLKGALSPDLFEHVRTISRDRIRYNRVTEEFAVVRSDGYIKTYYKPRPCWTIPAPPPGTVKRKCHHFYTNWDYVQDTCARP
jgi:hypothetical protein